MLMLPHPQLPALQVMGQGTALAKMLPPSDVYINSTDW